MRSIERFLLQKIAKKFLIKNLQPSFFINPFSHTSSFPLPLPLLQTRVAGGTKLLTIAATSFPCFSAASPAATCPVTV